jgi:hypothetical protein
MSVLVNPFKIKYKSIIEDNNVLFKSEFKSATGNKYPIISKIFLLLGISLGISYAVIFSCAGWLGETAGNCIAVVAFFIPSVALLMMEEIKDKRTDVCWDIIINNLSEITRKQIAKELRDFHLQKNSLRFLSNEHHSYLIDSYLINTPKHHAIKIMSNDKADQISCLKYILMTGSGSFSSNLKFLNGEVVSHRKSELRENEDLRLNELVESL